ncbi:hypothetical protein ACIA5H_30060 [Nocardia sp. NPDC051900]|uniref:hypothetical protein n=1 Tax=Nocardia sp. NPDC051900 TaxID=3364326 RepID=UPI00379C4B63
MFGNAEVWDLNGVIRRPANQPVSAWKLLFSMELVEPTWNLRARELSMILLNPRHPAVLAVEISGKPRPTHPRSVIAYLSNLRRLARWATENGLPAELATWTDSSVRGFISYLRGESTSTTAESPLAGNTLRTFMRTLSLLHQFRDVLSCRGLRNDPCQGTSVWQATKSWTNTTSVSTPAVVPEIWFPLIRAAWTYVHTFSRDILHAQHRYATLCASARSTTAGVTLQLEQWLTARAQPIPIYASPTGDDPLSDPRPNWRALTLELGIAASRDEAVFGSGRPDGRRRREAVLQAIAAGHPTTTGFIDDLAQVQRPDEIHGPWHPGLDADAIHRERTRLRDAAFTLIAGLSMMRDSEIHEIARNSVVEHYGYPAVTSTKHKHDPALPRKTWWITAPVAEAITVAEQLSVHPDRVFAPVHADDAAGAVHGTVMVDNFIAHINATRHWTGLDEIPAGPARPHMFRKTMAMLTDQFPGSEIALGIQLKHVATRALANRSTQGYAAADLSWAEHLDSAIDAARFRRLEDLYASHKAGDPIGYGPAADRLAKTFANIQKTVKTRGGDATVERALLRKARISLRFGTLNHCAFDENNPTGAVCLEDTITPADHTGPLQDRCRPDRCANSMIGPEHLPIWEAEKRSLLTLIDTPKLPACRKAALQQELSHVEAVLHKADKEQR